MSCFIVQKKPAGQPCTSVIVTLKRPEGRAPGAVSRCSPHSLLITRGFAKKDDAVGVGAFKIVVHAPAVGGFGEFLVVDEDEDGFEAGGDDFLDIQAQRNRGRKSVNRASG